MDHVTHLALAAARGDREAMERFVAETQGDVWRLCAHLGDRRDADDLAQETYERAIGAIHRFRADGSAKSWLLGIARRVCADHIRRSQRHRRRWRAAASESAVDVRPATWRDQPSERVELDAALDALDDDRKAAFVLTQVLGLHYDEAAEVLGCPIGTIRSRVARARLDLVDVLGEAPAPGRPGDQRIGRRTRDRPMLRSTGTEPGAATT
ncbi:MAG: sigma-70 family RNA polymerase sigma factor [Actinomycetota bacterium]